jgi:puromycin-sensitive aminopeptidase
MVAVSEFSGGAMESYGLVIYRENELLHDVFCSLQQLESREQVYHLLLASFFV